MSAPAPAARPPADPWEMALIHRILRHGFDEVRRLISAVPPGATARARVVAEHTRFTLDELHNHHSTEDELLWPALHERANPSEHLIRRMEAQHAAVDTAVGRVRQLIGPWQDAPTSETSAALSGALAEVISVLAEHLAEEEREVVPLIAQHVTQQEWETIGQKGFEKFTPSQRFTAMGQMLEVATPGEAARMLSDLPAPIRLIWRLVGKRKYARYVAVVRG